MRFKIRWKRIWKVVKWPIAILLGFVAAWFLILLAAGFIYGNNLTGEE